jgi:hypothetical protein
MSAHHQSWGSAMYNGRRSRSLSAIGPFALGLQCCKLGLLNPGVEVLESPNFCRCVILPIRYAISLGYYSCAPIGFRKMDEEFCRERARIVRELADKADPFIKKRLQELASHYERRLAIRPKPETEKEKFRPDVRGAESGS